MDLYHLPWGWIGVAIVSLIAIFKGKVVYVFLLSLIGVFRPRNQKFITEQSKIIAGQAKTNGRK